MLVGEHVHWATHLVPAIGPDHGRRGTDAAIHRRQRAGDSHREAELLRALAEGQLVGRHVDAGHRGDHGAVLS